MNEFELIEQIFNQQKSLNPSQKSDRQSQGGNHTHIETDCTDIANFTTDIATEIICGIGDDSAVLKPATGQQLVSCVDTLISGRHFPKNTAPFAIGYKSVAVNLSDLAAMGAKPHSILLAISLPSVDKTWLTEFAQGLFACCQPHGVTLIGGDTTKSEVLSITITALGFANQCVYRAGANVGDLIAVSGTLGDATYALAPVLAGKPHPLQHRLDTPTPRVSLGLALNGLASSMMDVSDGLLQDLGHILTASDVSAKLDIDKLPTHPLLHALPQTTRLTHQLSGGDDYELLFTFPQAVKQQVLALANQDVPISIIGEVTQKNNNNQKIALYFNGQSYIKPSDSGYQHF